MIKHFQRSLFVGTVFFGSLAMAHLGAQVAPNAASAKDLPPPMLDHDEMAQFNNARQAVFKTHPELQAQEEKFKSMHDASTTPTAEQRNAAFAEWKTYQKKMRAEMLKVDPGLKPVFAKIDAARKNAAPH